MWEELRDQRIFITGGTGFFGVWLLESFISANTRLNLNAEAYVLTRDKSLVSKKHPHLFENTALRFLEGDVSDFKFPQGDFSHIIHAATESSMSLNENNPVMMWDTIVQGTKNLLEFALHCKAKHFLLVSSGAVYGGQPSNITNLAENYPCQPKLEDFGSAYAVGKLAAENLCCLYSKQYGLNVKIARCFAFIGPYLPLDGHFAIGNFIRDGLKGGPIIVNGDGAPYRSYLYVAELVTWLWTILFRGATARSYNVGSDVAYTIAELAHIVAKSFSPVRNVTVMKAQNISFAVNRYVPDISRVWEELGLAQKMNLEQSIQSTISWYSNLGQTNAN